MVRNCDVRACVQILQAAAVQIARVGLPLATIDGKGIGGRPTGLAQLIERERPTNVSGKSIWA